MRENKIVEYLDKGVDGGIGVILQGAGEFMEIEYTDNFVDNFYKCG